MNQHGDDMESPDARIIRGAAIPTAIAGLLVTIASFAVVGGKGGVGALLGLVVVVAFFGVSVVVVSRVPQELLMTAAMMSYVVKLAVLFGLIVAVRNVSFLEPKAFAWAVIVGTVAWIASETIVTSRLKGIYIEHGSDLRRPVDRNSP